MSNPSLMPNNDIIAFLEEFRTEYYNRKAKSTGMGGSIATCIVVASLIVSIVIMNIWAAAPEGGARVVAYVLVFLFASMVGLYVGCFVDERRAARGAPVNRELSTEELSLVGFFLPEEDLEKLRGLDRAVRLSDMITLSNYYNSIIRRETERRYEEAKKAALVKQRDLLTKKNPAASM